MTARLTSAMLVSSLIRLVSQAGGNAVVLVKGDANAGSVLLYCCERGVFTSLQERILAEESNYRWQRVGPSALSSAGEIDAYLTRRKARDSDIWLIELDIANAERFAAETIVTD
jgi:hypothetical protein